MNLQVDKIKAAGNSRMEFDPKGFFVIMVDSAASKIIVEHYENIAKDKWKVGTGRLNLIIEGSEAEAICQTITREGLVSLHEHAAYLGRELQKAENALKTGQRYEQDGDAEW